MEKERKVLIVGHVGISPAVIKALQMTAREAMEGIEEVQKQLRRTEVRESALMELRYSVRKIKDLQLSKPQSKYHK